MDRKKLRNGLGIAALCGLSAAGGAYLNTSPTTEISTPKPREYDVTVSHNQSGKASIVTVGEYIPATQGGMQVGRKIFEVRCGETSKDSVRGNAASSSLDNFTFKRAGYDAGGVTYTIFEPEE